MINMVDRVDHQFDRIIKGGSPPPPLPPSLPTRNFQTVPFSEAIPLIAEIRRLVGGIPDRQLAKIIGYEGQSNFRKWEKDGRIPVHAIIGLKWYINELKPPTPPTPPPVQQELTLEPAQPLPPPRPSTPDYDAMLAELRTRRAKIDKAIAAIETYLSVET